MLDFSLFRQQGINRTAQHEVDALSKWRDAFASIPAKQSSLRSLLDSEA